MNFSTLVARRYLKSSSDNRFFSWIGILSVCGISIGVAVMIIVLSVINGFEVELKKRFLGANSHIMLYRFPYGMTEHQHWQKTIENDYQSSITASSPFIHYQTMAKNGSFVHSTTVRGITPHQREKVQTLKNLVSPLSALDVLESELKSLPRIPSIIVGKGLLNILDAKIGDQINLISPNSDSLGELRPFKVIGQYYSGLNFYDDKLTIISLSAAQKIFGMKDKVTGLEIGLRNADESIRIGEDMGSRYQLSSREWQNLHKSFFDALSMERFLIVLIVSLIGIVATFNVLTTLIVSVAQKQKDISIFKSLGATNKQIMKTFIKQGFYLGGLGSAIGGTLALVGSYLIENYQFIELPDPYHLDTLPMTYHIEVYVVVIIINIILTTCSGIIPSYYASKVNPADGLKGFEQNAKSD